jgi:hypothetical protein
MRPIKNYSSTIPINRIFENLQKTLVAHGAKQITFDYGDDGKVHGLSFVILLGEQRLQVKLPARLDNAQAVLKQQYEAGLVDRRATDPEQAYRVAWRNIWDWVEAQMALLEIGMVKLEEIFLPYVMDSSGRTLFEAFEYNRYQLPAGERREGTRE